jgi:hypothetical protein
MNALTNTSAAPQDRLSRLIEKLGRIWNAALQRRPVIHKGPVCNAAGEFILTGQGGVLRAERSAHAQFGAEAKAWLQEKQRAEAFARMRPTPEAKDAYVDEVCERCGIELNDDR